MKENYVSQFLKALPPERKQDWFTPADRESRAAMSLEDSLTINLIKDADRKSLHK